MSVYACTKALFVCTHTTCKQYVAVCYLVKMYSEYDQIKCTTAHVPVNTPSMHNGVL